MPGVPSGPRYTVGASWLERDAGRLCGLVGLGNLLPQRCRLIGAQAEPAIAALNRFINFVRIHPSAPLRQCR